MRHPFVFLILLVRSAPAQDSVAIERLHQQDIAAAKAGDSATLATLWTDDAVALPPGEQPVIGIDAIREWLKKGQESGRRFEITEYRIDFQETRVLGDEAIEWGRTRVSMRPKGGQAGMTISGSILRVLRRQPDGSWKVARAIWNMDPPAKEPPRDH
jgi:uncharacterized protein (TIGR02246 family)